ncbi:hypothetical protein MRB53_038326 [Persea americana]|nr:hypothetical protein MRB53_038326 [Persea americana]
MLVFDGDRTISVEDTGSMFWNQVAKVHRSADLCDPLKRLFGSNLQYTHRAFEQCRILYEDTIHELGQVTYNQICDEVAMAVTILPEVHALLQLSADVEHVGALVVTCGQSRIWRKVMERIGLSGKVQVIGGGCLSDGFVVTPAVKRAVVSHLQHMHQNYVWAFGDSPLDLDMLQEADEAIVVVGDAHTRSQSMEDSLRKAVNISGSTFRQMLLPRDVTPRLNTAEVPLVRVEDIKDDIKSRFVTHATDKAAAKLLMTPTRDARLSGPALRNAHHSVGWYLAVEYLTKVVGVEPYAIPHPKSGTTDGHQLLHEAKTLIVAIMRGGEPMALGVSDVFPKAVFKHANDATDLTDAHLKGVSTIILVDSVVNEGVTVQNFVEHIRDAQPSIFIVIIAGVVQSQSVSVNGSLRALARKHGKLRIIALRISENKYTGSGTSDTGNRLFNTTHFDK